jgi:hypothetical protein
MARPRYTAPIRVRASLARRAGTRTPRQTLLIVCEGETEKYYFEALRAHYQLRASEVVIPADATGNDPGNLVRYAERRASEGFDFVYCVFDRDQHANFASARQRIHLLANRRRPLPIYEAASVPAFEVWVLQHFAQSEMPFANADEVIAHLRGNPLPNYDKADRRISERLVQNVDLAVRNAQWLAQRNAASGSRNPFTNVHELVLLIQRMAAEAG